VLGLTGGIATGKTMACEYLKTLGATVTDADELSRALTAPGGEALSAIRARFGEHVFDGEALNRRALARQVFGDDALRRDLEAIIHPLVTRGIERAILEAANAGEKLIVLAAPLLFEAGLEGMCDAVWLTDVDERTQLRRVMARDGMAESEARARISSQLPSDIKRGRASLIIDTSGDIANTRAALKRHFDALQMQLDY